jgi:hypothetical protein
VSEARVLWVIWDLAEASILQWQRGRPAPRIMYLRVWGLGALGADREAQSVQRHLMPVLDLTPGEEFLEFCGCDEMLRGVLIYQHVQYIIVNRVTA